jgi:hypothetical protein
LAKSSNLFDVPLCPSTHITAQAVPRTVLAALGWVMATRSVPVVGGGVLVAFETVTVRAAVARPPEVSVTVRPSVCEPLPTATVFQANDAVVPLTVCVETVVPSTVSANVREVAVDPLTDMPTVLVPLTVAPAAGLVNAAVSVGVGVGVGVGDGAGAVMPFRVVMVTVVAPVLPAESVTLAVSDCEPSATIFVSYAIDTGPRLAVVTEPMGLPPSVSE